MTDFREGDTVRIERGTEGYDGYESLGSILIVGAGAALTDNEPGESVTLHVLKGLMRGGWAVTVISRPAPPPALKAIGTAVIEGKQRGVLVDRDGDFNFVADGGYTVFVSPFEVTDFRELRPEWAGLGDLLDEAEAWRNHGEATPTDEWNIDARTILIRVVHHLRANRKERS